MGFSDVKQPGPFNAQDIIVLVCCSLGLYNALELLLLIFTTFHHYSGLYFWSLLVASFGLLPYSIGWLIGYFQLTNNWVGFGINNVGWVTIITGQSVVLYSRLHLVVRNENILRAVKWMIIVDAVVLHVSTIVVHLGSNLGHHEAEFRRAWDVVERIQMTGFCLQEFIISGIYVWKTMELLRVVKKKGTKRVMWQLLTINVVIIVMDIALLALEYRGFLIMEQAFKVVIYSIKLKLEFAILGKLVEIVQQNGRELSQALSDTHDYVDETRRSIDVPAANATESTSRPRWTNNLEKSKHVQHIEKIDDSFARDDIKEEITSVSLEPVQTRSTADLSFPRAMKTRTSSDLMYAEAVRSITASSK